MKNILVSDVMTRNVNTVNKDTNILECAKKMVRKNTGSLVIVEGKKLAGIISNKDILWALVKKHYANIAELARIKASDLSPKKIAFIRPSATIDQAVEKMKKVKFYRLPVVRKKELVGLITMKDILNFHPELYSEIKEFANIQEESEKIQRVEKAEKRVPIEEGVCEECGEVNLLYREDAVLVCASCLSSH